MHYYDVRCELCNKFITEEDMRDDGLRGGPCPGEDQETATVFGGGE